MSEWSTVHIQAYSRHVFSYIPDIDTISHLCMHGLYCKPLTNIYIKKLSYKQNNPHAVSSTDPRLFSPRRQIFMRSSCPNSSNVSARKQGNASSFRRYFWWRMRPDLCRTCPLVALFKCSAFQLWAKGSQRRYCMYVVTGTYCIFSVERNLPNLLIVPFEVKSNIL